MQRLLVDTHTLLWWALDDPQLSAAARHAVSLAGNDVHVSAASAWEIAIKASLGRLEVPDDLEALFTQEMRASRFRPLPVTLRHALAVRDLPLHHRDPFDRLLVAQAICEGLTLVTGDADIARYDAPVLW